MPEVTRVVFGGVLLAMLAGSALACTKKVSQKQCDELVDRFRLFSMLRVEPWKVGDDAGGQGQLQLG